MNEHRFELNSCILLIEDDTDLGDTLRAVFEDEGYQVHLAAQTPSVDEVVDIKPDLVMLDIGRHEPEAGWRFVRELKATPDVAELPVVVSSADGAIVEAQDVRVRAEAAAILLKPFSIDDLLPVVATAIAHHERTHEEDRVIAERPLAEGALGSIWY